MTSKTNNIFNANPRFSVNSDIGPMHVPLYARLTFFFLGISSLIGWNAILIGLDFFLRKFNGYDAGFYFSIPMFIASNLLNVLIHKLSKYASINTRISIGLLGQMIMVIILPIEANYLSNGSGFYLELFLIFIEGCFISLMQSSAVAFASLISYSCINDFFTGTGVGGVLICGIRLIVLAIMGADDDDVLYEGTLIYCIVAGVFLLLTVAVYRVFYYSRFCIQVLARSMKKTMLHTDNIIDQIVAGGIENDHEEHEKHLKLVENTDINESEKTETVEHFEKRNHIHEVLKKIHPMPALVWLIYVQTFMVFPGLALQKNISGVNAAWGSTLLVFIYNVGDSIGKYLCSFRRFYNKESTIVLIMGRFLFYISFIVILTSPDAGGINTNWFAFLNMFLFALSNGYATSSVMILGPEQVRTKDEKETTGFIMTNGLSFGMMSGSFLALIFKNIGK